MSTGYTGLFPVGRNEPTHGEMKTKIGIERKWELEERDTILFHRANCAMMENKADMCKQVRNMQDV